MRHFGNGYASAITTGPNGGATTTTPASVTGAPAVPWVQKRYPETLQDTAWLRSRYIDEELSLTQVAALSGSSKQAVRHALLRRGIPLREVTAARNMLRKPPATKAMMVAAYGGACACCGETEMAFLSLDHIGGGGIADRAAHGSYSTMMRHLRDTGWPTDRYRVLCMNCQFGTRYGRTCPHQITRVAASPAQLGGRMIGVSIQ